MESQIIVVGSTRKPKLGAVQQAIAAFAEIPGSAQSLGAFQIEGMEVESGVNHTPLSREESMRGARQRVETLQAIARQQGKQWKYFVGLEGGLDTVIENGERRVFLENYAFVTDGTRGFFGRSGAVELPQPLVEEVFVRGTELAIAIDAFAGAVGIRDAQGAWGILTGNKITRQDAFRVAVIAAFAPFLNPQAYGRGAISASNQ